LVERNFQNERAKLKMEPIAIVAIVGIVATGAWLLFVCRRNKFAKLPKSPSTENLSTMVQEDPIPVSS
jgi:hypothetical protein